MLENIQHAKITILNSCRGRVTREITLSDAIKYIQTSEGVKTKVEKIRASTPEQRKSLKVGTLEALVIAGLFDKQVKNEFFLNSSGLVCIDVDHIGDVEASKRIISKIEHVVACFVSPSGDGLKVLLRINGDKLRRDADLKALFPYARELFLNNGGFRIDEACKDVARLCFASYDPDIYVNYNATVFDPVIVPVEAKKYDTQTHVNGGDVSKKCIDTVVKIIISSAPGERHQARIKAARLAGGYIAGGVVDEGEIRAVLQRASDFMSTAGVTDRGEQQTLEDGLKMGMERPLFNTLTKQDKVIHEDKKNDDKWINADEMANAATAPVYLINNIIESKTHGIIAGASQSFKSFCVIKMAHSICTGGDFFGHDVFTTGKVLYICGEGLGALGRRIKAIKIVEGDFNNNFFVLNKPLFIDNIAEMAWLKEQIDFINPLFVAFDTFSSLATSTKENVNEEVARVLRMVSDCCLESGASSIVVHHYGKDADKGTRGASAFGANVDYEISLKRGEGLNAVMSCKKSKDGDFFEDIEILAHVVELGLVRQDGSMSSSLIIKKASGDEALSPRQQKALSGIKETIKEHGSFINGVHSITERQVKDCFNILFEDEGKNKYGMFGKIVPSLCKKGVLFELGGVFWM